jgi:hypothetical protein
MERWARTRLLLVTRARIWVLVGSCLLGAVASQAEPPPPGVNRTHGGAPSSVAPCIALGLPTMLAKQQFGDAIQDGVGYGGVRLGVPVSELVRRWGVGNCTVGVPEPTYVYLATRGGGQRDGELIAVQVKQGRVFMLIFALPPHGASVPPSLTTSLGIKLASTPRLGGRGPASRGQSAVPARMPLHRVACFALGFAGSGWGGSRSFRCDAARSSPLGTGAARTASRPTPQRG